jgi:hypothetical protein
MGKKLLAFNGNPVGARREQRKEEREEEFSVNI